MRPHVSAAQNVRPAVLRRANPRTRAGIRMLHAGARAVAQPAVRASVEHLGRRFGGVAAENIRLPDYGP
ncbi:MULTISPECIES: hypothetical protein [Mycobacterium]|uniref:Uncharacterized protein n=1 Tax=Mycobacterium kiyosense TaxID=2871094 RepID=A0A9P3QEP1_9MYCO|nr:MULTISPECIES: hypothetical protein [Mycobacterium]BDB43233.1 hypothetical protein IWGMT90018_36790 [Mycobacterium kiyosense]BDE13566.1 hypothetical protein MKCMC460_24260 [Mycobacterium sp. 20KCMC460]GLB83372.1 hypothetical protein SRL2020028_26280 [Mycobacterium kiyosense]GLB93022.1 hypothetical protein SRL2020130_58390 [Mycobacterium kiyosense]GLB99118.1 hypothetical protein SRL2020226_58940 [Mycobacterium kiyosense]